MAKGLCSKCKVALTEENASPAIFKSGRGYCRGCVVVIHKDNPEYYRAAAVRFRKRNPEKVKLYTDTYRKNMGEEAKARSKAVHKNWLEKKKLDLEYTERNRARDRERNKNPLRKQYFRLSRQKKVETDPSFVEKEKIRCAARYLTLPGKHSSLKAALREDCVSKTDLLWNFNFYQELIKDSSCYYCLGVLKPGGHGLDRMDNSLGHVCFNVVPCCWDCNELKGIRLSYEEMMLLVPVLREIRLRRERTKEVLSGNYADNDSNPR